MWKKGNAPHPSIRCLKVKIIPRTTSDFTGKSCHTSCPTTHKCSVFWSTRTWSYSNAICSVFAPIESALSSRGDYGRVKWPITAHLCSVTCFIHAMTLWCSRNSVFTIVNPGISTLHGTCVQKTGFHCSRTVPRGLVGKLIKFWSR